MAKKEELKSQLVIYKTEGYKNHKIILGLDKSRTIDFNDGKEISVTEEELKAIGKHRWLGVK